MKLLLMGGLCGALALPAQAAGPVPDTPAQYTHTLPVAFQGSGALMQLRLPPAVYLHARSATLDDVRLFDRHGHPVPFALTMPLAQRGSHHTVTPAKVFALPADATATDATLAVRTTQDGALVSVRTRPGQPAPGLAALLIDLGPPTPDQAPATALVFAPPAGMINYSARVTLEASDDLQEWHIITEAPLNWLSNSASDTLTNNRIAFGARSVRYLRVRWRAGKPAMFAGIAAERDTADAPASVPDTLTVPAQAGVFAGDLVYPVGVAVPVRTIGMPLDQAGVVIPSEVGHYIALAGGRWQFEPLLRTTFYRIVQDGAVRTPPDTSTTPLSVDRLVIRPTTPLAIRPALRIGWLPTTMVFAAREAGPYTLAVGRPGARSGQMPLADIAPGYHGPELLKLQAATPGPAVVQTPVPAQEAGAVGRTAVLWGVLLLGVLVVAIMTWKLVLQLRAGPDRDP